MASVTCSCHRAGHTSSFFRALHIEQFDSPHSSDLSQLDSSSGWPLVQFLTVPNALKVQRGVVSRGSHFSHGLVASLSLDVSSSGSVVSGVGSLSPAFASSLSSVLSSARSFAGGERPGDKTSVFVGLSSRALTLMGEREGADEDGVTSDRVPTLAAIYSANEVRDNTPNPRLLIPATDSDILVVVKGGSAESCYATMCHILLRHVGATMSPNTHTASAVLPKSSEQFLSTKYGSLSLTSCRNVSGRDLPGFIDGTVNPDASLRASVQIASRPDGSSAVYSAKFVHDLPFFRELTVDQKCAVVGRNYGALSSARSCADARVENPRSGNPGIRDTRGHVFRAWGEMLRLAMPFHDGGEDAPPFPEGCPMSEQRAAPLTAPLGYPMVRGNVALPETAAKGNVDEEVPKGQAPLPPPPPDDSRWSYNPNIMAAAKSVKSDERARAGLYFLAAAKDISEVQESLKRMCGYYAVEFDGGVGSIDNLFSITTAETGGFFFVPSLRMLDVFAAKLAGREAPPEKSEEEALEEIRKKLELSQELTDLKPIDDSKRHRKEAKRIMRKYECPHCESPQDCIFEEGSGLFRCTFCGRVQYLDALSSNIVILDHFNLNHKKFDHSSVSAFYFHALGLVLDDRRRANFDKGRGSLWANAGANQIHLSEAEDPQSFDGVIHLSYASEAALEALKTRCSALGLPFSVDGDPSSVTVRCPYGNVIRCGVGHADPRGKQPPCTWKVEERPDIKPDDLCLALEMLEFHVKDAADLPGIGRFYQKAFGAKAALSPDVLDVAFGPFQTVRFRVDEVLAKNDEYEDGFGPHISLFVKDLETCWREMEGMGLIFISPRFDRSSRTLDEALANKTFRTLRIVDPDDGRLIVRLEHEISAIASHKGEKNVFFPFKDMYAV